jgi:hypothetical protein
VFEIIFILDNYPVKDQKTITIPMRRNSTSSIGALHPVLFFMLVYGISLVMSIFVCRTVYYSLNNDMASNPKSSIKADLSYSGTTASVAVLK